MKEDLVRKLILEKLGVEASNITSLVGGQVGHVNRVDAADKSYVVKLVDVRLEPSFSEERPDDRVYGSRWSNLLPTYELLKKSNILVPKLYASGSLESENVHYEILEYLSGDSDDYSAQWFAAVGKTLGSTHQIKREYQGWIGMETPYSKSWRDAFAESLKSQLQQAKPYIPNELYASTSNYLKGSVPISEPEAFVLSHTDGFQGILKKVAAEWSLVGVVDIEDYQFTDQRFVLAGFELSHVIEKRIIPEEFWRAYSETVPIDPTFDTSKKMFQIYYLLVWSRVVKDQPESFNKCLDKLSELVR